MAHHGPIQDPDGIPNLIRAVFDQARADIENHYGDVIKFRQACERGTKYKKPERANMAITPIDAESAVYWFKNMPQSKELREMIATIEQYHTYCVHCGEGESVGNVV